MYWISLELREQTKNQLMLFKKEEKSARRKMRIKADIGYNFDYVTDIDVGMIKSANAVE